MNLRSFTYMIVLITMIGCQKSGSPNKSAGNNNTDKSKAADQIKSGDENNKDDTNDSNKNKSPICDFDISLMKDFKTDDLQSENIISIQDKWVDIAHIDANMKIKVVKDTLNIDLVDNREANKLTRLAVPINQIVSIKTKEISDSCVQPAYIYTVINDNQNVITLEWFSDFSTDASATKENLKITYFKNNQEITRVFLRQKSLLQLGIGNRFPINANKMKDREAYNFLRETMRFYNGNAILNCKQNSIECYQASLATNISTNTKDLLKARMITYENGGNTNAAIYINDSANNEVLNLKGLIKVDLIGDKKRLIMFMKPVDESRKPIGSEGYGNFKEQQNSVNLIFKNDDINGVLNIEGDILIQNEKGTVDSYFISLTAPARQETNTSLKTTIH